MASGRTRPKLRPYIAVGNAHPTRIGQHSLFNQRLDDLFHEEGIPFGFLQDESLERLQRNVIPDQRREQFLRVLLSKWVEPQLGVVGLIAPLVPVLRAEVYCQEDSRGRDALTQQQKERLGFAVQPMQILDDEDERLVQALQ